MKKLILLLLSASFTCQAQSHQDIQHTIQQFFKGMYESDTTLIKSTLASKVNFQTITAQNQVKTEDMGAFVQSIAKAPAHSLDERITFDGIHVDGNLASVWTGYHFYYQGKFSHCGVNSFLMHRDQEKWKIIGVIDTRRKGGCNPE